MSDAQERYREWNEAFSAREASGMKMKQRVAEEIDIVGVYPEEFPDMPRCRIEAITNDGRKLRAYWSLPQPPERKTYLYRLDCALLTLKHFPQLCEVR